jgi:hypothetical protein
MLANLIGSAILGYIGITIIIENWIGTSSLSLIVGVSLIVFSMMMFWHTFRTVSGCWGDWSDYSESESESKNRECEVSSDNPHIASYQSAIRKLAIRDRDNYDNDDIDETNKKEE